MYTILLIVLMMLCQALISQSNSVALSRLLKLRGGNVPLGDFDGTNYFTRFEIDYGTPDTQRIAGKLGGLVHEGELSSLPQSDLFIKWFNEYLENGPPPLQEAINRLKPFYVSYIKLWQK